MIFYFFKFTFHSNNLFLSFSAVCFFGGFLPKPLHLKEVWTFLIISWETWLPGTWKRPGRVKPSLFICGLRKPQASAFSRLRVSVQVSHGAPSHNRCTKPKPWHCSRLQSLLTVLMTTIGNPHYVTHLLTRKCRIGFFLNSGKSLVVRVSTVWNQKVYYPKVLNKPKWQFSVEAVDGGSAQGWMSWALNNWKLFYFT